MGDEGLASDLDLDYLPRLGRKTDDGIGAIGAGFIMRDARLEAYRQAGFRVVAIASRQPEHAQEIAARYGIPRVHGEWRALLADPEVEIVDSAFPPHEQPLIVRAAARHAGRIRGILAQKPLAPTLTEVAEMVWLVRSLDRVKKGAV